MRRNKHRAGSGALAGAGRHCMAALLLCVSAVSTPAFAESSITFNLKNAELQTVIATVAEFTGKNFIIDPRVKGKVTIISAKPMNADEVYQTFLSLLEVHNFAAVESGNVIKILPSVNAKQQGGASVDAGKLYPTDEIITRVIEVRHVSASQLVPILRPLIPQQGHMAAYAATNVLIVSDRSANVQRLLNIIRRIDVSSASDIEVYALKHAAAGEVVRVLETLNQRGKRSDPKGASGAPVLVADERTNSILISGGKAERLAIRAIITHLDTPLESSGNTHVIYLRYAKAKDLVPVLTGLGQSLEKGRGGGKSSPQAARSPITIQAHETTNSLVITAPQDLMRSMKSVIKQLDVRRAQVLVEATIADVSLDASGALGVSWFVDGSPGNSGPIAGTIFGAPLDAPAAALALSNGELPSMSSPTSFLGVGRFNSSNVDATVLLTALEGAGKANVLSRPTIMTLDNEEAEIVVGQNVPFITGAYANTGGSTSSPTNPFTTIKRENVGITLKVKPQINEGDAVRLDIEQKVDNVAPSSAGAADLITNTRSIKTSVLIDDGDTIVLGGLIKDDLSETERKVPGLGDIPFLGALFRYKSTTKNKTNLMVFIKPSIVRDAAVATRLTSGKYDYIRAEQMRFREDGIAFIENEDIPVLPEFLDLPPSYEEIQSQAVETDNESADDHNSNGQ